MKTESQREAVERFVNPTLFLPLFLSLSLSLLLGDDAKLQARERPTAISQKEREREIKNFKC